MTTQLPEQSAPGALAGKLDFDIVHSAITQARKDQICDVASLRSKLQQFFPQREADIEASLIFWANQMARNYA